MGNRVQIQLRVPRLETGRPIQTEGFNRLCPLVQEGPFVQCTRTRYHHRNGSRRHLNRCLLLWTRQRCPPQRLRCHQVFCVVLSNGSLPPPPPPMPIPPPAPLGTRRHASEIALAKETRPQSRSRTEELVIAYNELNKENTNRKVVEEALPGSGSGFRTTQVTTDAEQRQEIGVGRIARTLCFAFHNLANT